jgi:choline dehydrogenase-like flavoprotein
VDACGKVQIELNCDEFELLLRGMRRIARIYFAAAKPDDGVTLHLPTKALLTRCGRPLEIRSMEAFEWALSEIRRRGPAFVNLLTTHCQGGVAMGDVVDTMTFRVKTDSGEVVENLTVSDSSMVPAGCEINPQLTVKALATLASAQIMARSGHQQKNTASTSPPTQVKPAA